MTDSKYVIGTNGKYFEKVVVPTVAKDVEAEIEIHVVSVKLPAPNENVATEMADAVVRKLVEKRQNQ